jgi:thioredoxin-dependent peroxiredoxin
VRIFGVSFDSQAGNRAFAEKFDFPYLLLCDTERELGLAYGACDAKDDGYARRLTFVIGPDGKLEHAIDTKDPAGQADALIELLGPKT